MIKKAILLIATLTIITTGLAIFTLSYSSHSILSDDTKITLSKESSASTNQDAEAWLRKNYREYSLPSLSAAVAINGKIIWAGAIGYSNLEQKINAKPRTQYRFGSIAKSLTSAALIKLDSHGTIDIDKRFTDYIQDWKQQEAGFTLSDLASHQSGVRHYGSGLNQLFETLSDTSFANMREAANIVENETPLFSPKSDFHYSTYGYNLLALAMEKATNQDFASIVKQEILNPATMENTELEHRDTEYPNKACSYIDIGGYIVEAPNVDMSNKYPGGGYLSTPTDIAKFGSFLLNEYESTDGKSILTKHSSENQLNENSNNNYGLGIKFDSDQLGKRYYHGGTSVGGRAYLSIYPERKMVVAFASNITPATLIMDRKQAALELAQVFQ